MKKISIEFVIRLHEMLIKESGGSKGVRDINLLESALYSPLQTFGDRELYPDDLDKIVSISHSLIKNHSFIDGNKRIGTLVLYMLLKENGYELEWTDEEVIEIGLKVANGEMRKEDLKKFIKRRLV
ncbi:type II toxin-antitoxin system death-on-curing family toxin [Peptoniphilus harei]|uniref:type II toxin-antitoxin system death-on-curing family toxin n=1 Tax=Peptoniphilus TaxID=162289 RepID=UPI0018974A55|nr:type II toxin-antitoxin system death-on-curing family toxin [Peptoniphilus harei]MDK7355022.1 type II toxin-antitoxin system death-on-curing family toxin [Peptoniphilus harei]MDK7370576.1 type II toxin-antitoxin system death-on-curing family toxin [Peptoniphilus harei]MDK7377195.1 type II toxin-antitoxin system death-on-curing family toxin [Peptoniphilus harei]MDK7679509.1 type II toxin-antitoxin system death-on-curing family toxin [Peptoniphilus harei]MDU5324743.1 type II toxin-antitoxin s